ncbi:MAG TPA: ABC transporter permease [Longimicrobium sp.]|nr:ABC transporter permease [Longimicrobium sp.]
MAIPSAGFPTTPRMMSTVLEPIAAAQAPPSPAAVDDERQSALDGLREVIHDVRQYRYLLYQLALRDVRIRYKQAVLGVAWAVFMPSLIVLAGLAVRVAMAHLSGEPVAGREVSALAVKAVPWAFFVGTLQFATGALTGNSNLVTKVYFPREVLPLAATAAQMWDAAIACGVLGVALPLLGVRPTAALLWVPLLVVLFVLATCAAALAASCANLFFRDVKYIVQVLLTFGIFFTPVFLEPAMFGRAGARLVMLNPVAPLLQAFRLTIVDGRGLLHPVVTAAGVAWQPWWLAYSAAWAVLGCAGAALLFHRSQALFAEYA